MSRSRKKKGKKGPKCEGSFKNPFSGVVAGCILWCSENFINEQIEDAND